jgi:hypothetical protein
MEVTLSIAVWYAVSVGICFGKAASTLARKALRRIDRALIKAVGGAVAVSVCILNSATTSA